jgi:hypothetical protein
MGDAGKEAGERNEGECGCGQSGQHGSGTTQGTKKRRASPGGAPAPGVQPAHRSGFDRRGVAVQRGSTADGGDLIATARTRPEVCRRPRALIAAEHGLAVGHQ